MAKTVEELIREARETEATEETLPPRGARRPRAPFER